MQFKKSYTTNWFSLSRIICLIFPPSLFAPLQVVASGNYFDDGTASDVLSNVFSNGGCTGCHGTSGTACNSDGDPTTFTGFISYTVFPRPTATTESSTSWQVTLLQLVTACLKEAHLPTQLTFLPLVPGLGWTATGAADNIYRFSFVYQ